MLTFELNLISQVRESIRMVMSSGASRSNPSGVRARVPGRCVRGGRLRAGAGLRRIENGRFVQSKDKASGLPLWQVEVIDADASARTRTVKIKVAAQVQPVLPTGPAGVPFVPVEFTGLTVTPYVTQAGRLGYSLKASGVRSPGRPSGRPGTDGRESAA